MSWTGFKCYAPLLCYKTSHASSYNWRSANRYVEIPVHCLAREAGPECDPPKDGARWVAMNPTCLWLYQSSTWSLHPLSKSADFGVLCNFGQSMIAPTDSSGYIANIVDRVANRPQENLICFNDLFRRSCHPSPSLHREWRPCCIIY